MFKSKHSGWTYDLKRTPFGGGGSWSPADPFKGAGDALASIDPGPAIGNGLAEVDKFVGREVPGGWVLPAALAVAYATGYIDPSLFATEAAATAGAEAGAGAIATEAGQTAFFDALATGASSTEAVNAGLAADAALTGGIGAGTNAALQGPTYGELGVTGVEGGMAGPTYGELGYTGLNNAEAIAAADAAAQSGMSAKDVLSNANRLKNIAKLLTGSESSQIFQGNVPNANQWATQAAQNFAQATPEQFGGLYRMNQNPFSFGTQGQTVASPGMYDVSGSMANALRKA
jgi:hypothetical protein